MEYRKERNFIVAYDGVLKLGAWNISDGSFIGKSGKPVKTVPSCFTYNNLPESYDVRRNNAELEDILGYTIRCFREWCNRGYFNYTKQRGQRLEQLVSLGLYPYCDDDLDSKTPLTKDLVAYLKENHNSQYSSRIVREYNAEKKYSDFLRNKPDYIKYIFKQLISDLPYEYLKTILNRAEHEHVVMYYGNYNLSSLTQLIRRYYEICMQLYGNVEIKPNLLSNYAHLLYLEKEYKDAHYNENLMKHNNKAWLYYKNETFVVKPLLTKDDFHNEGERQNNCVERMYMERVHDGKTHVVTVRRVNNPDKNYITCEVSNNGLIVQYLAKCNCHPTERDAIEFKRTLQEYFNTVTKD